MAAATLTPRDLVVLEKIKDPESGPSAPIMIDSSLPKDPRITNNTTYQTIVQRESAIISSIQKGELKHSSLEPDQSSEAFLSIYQKAVAEFDDLINEFPEYASARNNRAQALRRIYGDEMLVQGSDRPTALSQSCSDQELVTASKKVLSDLDAAISLLSPLTSFAAISPQAAKTLSQAHTQKGAIYHLSAKRLSTNSENLRIDEQRREAGWMKIDFEENASRHFMLGGRYGNEIAKALAVASNPTAKLCGEMVREAMMNEYGGGNKAN
ncbi:hypothetical protein F5884DRAFT_315446 [Xylogone sp. PMI_703]|nr:hypothetical protein F5884DRAFT_315446 [Xylogone sp. PMI_703]